MGSGLASGSASMYPSSGMSDSVTAVPEHAKVVDRIDDLANRLGELRRHL